MMDRLCTATEIKLDRTLLIHNDDCGGVISVTVRICAAPI